MAKNVRFDDGKLIIEADEGSVGEFPLEWFPRLRGASMEELSAWRLIGRGEGIHWAELDEDLNVDLLFGVSVEEAPALMGVGQRRDASDFVQSVGIRWEGDSTAAVPLTPQQHAGLSTLFNDATRFVRTIEQVSR